MRKFNRWLVAVCAAYPSASCATTPATNPITVPSNVQSVSNQARPGYTGLYFHTSVIIGPDGGYTPGYPAVDHMEAGSPAEKAGLSKGDLILEVNGTDSRKAGSLAFAAGVKYVLRIRRGEEEREIVLTPTQRSR